MESLEVQVMENRCSDELARCSGTLVVLIPRPGEVGAGSLRGPASTHTWGPSRHVDAYKNHPAFKVGCVSGEEQYVWASRVR